MGIISKSRGVQIVVSFRWSGQSGNEEPSVITISAPQQTLAYTPNFLFTSPFCGTKPPTSGLSAYFSINMSNRGKNVFSSGYCGKSDYHSDEKCHSPN